MSDRKRIYPPVYFLGALILMAALHAGLPLRVVVAPPFGYLGGTLIVIGVALATWGSNLFNRAGTTIKPFEESSVLVTRGPFRITRNPMYLALTVVLLGVWLLLGSLSPALVVPLFVLAIDRLFIRREEAMLSERFGAAYDDYRRRVRRWI